MDIIAINKWLKKYKVSNYTINEDLSVDVEGDVDLYKKSLIVIPIRFRNVSGKFRCDSNMLVNLEGCPEHVSGDFYCGNNQLSSLFGGPEHVGGNFGCDGNQLTSLEGCPKNVGGFFKCNNNKLTSLIGCPSEIISNFSCSANNLLTLEGGPISVRGFFSCTDNKELYSLEMCPKVVGGRFYCGNNGLDSTEYFLVKCSVEEIGQYYEKKNLHIDLGKLEVVSGLDIKKKKI